jgi:hypothetical protein
MPKPGDLGTSPNQHPLDRQVCLPISLTSRKTRVPSCSRHLTVPRHPTRWARRPLRQDPKRCDARTRLRAQIDHVLEKHPELRDVIEERRGVALS